MVILFCISLITNEIEYHFYMLISHSVFFIVKSFCSLLYWIGCFSFSLMFNIFKGIYILHMKLLTDYIYIFICIYIYIERERDTYTHL